MEYGGITPVGLPAVMAAAGRLPGARLEVALIGSGVRRSKLLVPGPTAGRLPGAEVVEDLAG